MFEPIEQTIERLLIDPEDGRMFTKSSKMAVRVEILTPNIRLCMTVAHGHQQSRAVEKMIDLWPKFAHKWCRSGKPPLSLHMLFSIENFC